MSPSDGLQVANPYKTWAVYLFRQSGIGHLDALRKIVQGLEIPPLKLAVGPYIPVIPRMNKIDGKYGK